MKMNWRIALYAGAILVAISACTPQPKASLKGTVLESTEVFISEISPKQLKPLDTVLMSDQTFAYNKTFETPTFLLLEFSSGIRIPLLVEPNKTIEIAVNDTNDFGTFTATGSASSQRMAEQRDLLVSSLRVSDSLEYLSYLYKDSANFMDNRMAWNEVFVAQVNTHREALKKLIDQDTNDLSNIMAFYQSIGQLEIFTPSKNLDYYKKVDHGLQANFPENKHAIYFHEQLENYLAALEKQENMQAAAQNITEGNMAPEIALPDLDGQTIKLSDLKGKIVLIDFWASWCGPCRRTNPHLVELYNTYKNKNFDIFSVSLDGIDGQANAKNDWRFAIEKDGLIWKNHVSDLKGYNSEVVDLYGFEGIPFTVLIDEEGKIIAKNLRGEALDEQLKKLF